LIGGWPGWRKLPLLSRLGLKRINANWWPAERLLYLSLFKDNLTIRLPGRYATGSCEAFFHLILLL
jgi:hypothetical protein